MPPVVTRSGRSRDSMGIRFCVVLGSVVASASSSGLELSPLLGWPTALWLPRRFRLRYATPARHRASRASGPYGTPRPTPPPAPDVAAAPAEEDSAERGGFTVSNACFDLHYQCVGGWLCCCGLRDHQFCTCPSSLLSSSPALLPRWLSANVLSRLRILT